MLDILDALIATAAVVLGLSLIVQAIQQIFKQWLDLKSTYMKVQVLAMFNSGSASAEMKYWGLSRVSTLLTAVEDRAKVIATGLENALRSFGYKDLEALENVSPEKLKQIVSSINWSAVPGAAKVQLKIKDIEKEIDTWFDIAKHSFQDLYERRMKYWAFGISAVVVVFFNANLLDVYREFSTNKATRDAAVKMAEKFVAIPRDSILVKEKTAARDTTYVAVRPDSLIAKDIQESLTRIQSVVGANTFQLLRWTKNYRDSLFTHWFGGQWVKNWIKALFGWLGMTLLVSLGAPFWYDFLKAVMGIKEKMKK